MPVVLAALLLIVVVLFAAVVLVPISLLQRYRAGTMRRRARVWLITINAVGLTISTLLFLASAGLTTIWVPHAFAYALGGVSAGVLLGLAGLALTRWEPMPDGLMYTPNRWLVLVITVGVAGRIGYGLWRAWQAWESVGGGTSWAAASGVAESLGAGGVILGYYLAYWFGVRRRAHRQTIVS